MLKTGVVSEAVTDGVTSLTPAEAPVAQVAPHCGRGTGPSRMASIMCAT
jgi:hypothetical protein